MSSLVNGDDQLWCELDGTAALMMQRGGSGGGGGGGRSGGGRRGSQWSWCMTLWYDGWWDIIGGGRQQLCLFGLFCTSNKGGCRWKRTTWFLCCCSCLWNNGSFP